VSHKIGICVPKCDSPPQVVCQQFGSENTLSASAGVTGVGWAGTPSKYLSLMGIFSAQSSTRCLKTTKLLWRRHFYYERNEDVIMESSVTLFVLHLCWTCTVH